MVLECALLDVRPGLESEFEAAFVQARPLIEAQAGFESLRLERGLENPSRYLLLVEWETLEDHTDGFRRSPEYETWRALLHHFYDPFPVVEHFTSWTPSAPGRYPDSSRLKSVAGAHPVPPNT